VQTARPAPQSFGTPGLYGVNAFKFTNAQKQSVFIRYQIIPEAGGMRWRAASSLAPLFDGRVAGARGQGAGQVGAAAPS
jgi:hypothetical protein